jgi:hypothetical protein
MLVLRRRGRRGLYLGLLGRICPTTMWSTLLLQARHVCNTAFLITIISILIMHRICWLIKILIKLKEI